MDATISPVQTAVTRNTCRAPELSGRDADHLAALQRQWHSHRTFSSMTRLAAVLGLASDGGVFGVVGRLTEFGYLSRVDHRTAPNKRFFERRLLGSTLRCVPHPCLAGASATLSLDEYLIADPARTVLQRVHGSHGRGSGILEGDLVVVELRAPAQPGEIVLDICEREMDVKTLHRREDGRYLLDPVAPSGDSVRPLVALEALGVVKGVASWVRRTAHKALLTDGEVAP